MRYVHNAGVFDLADEDFDGVLTTDIEQNMVPLPYLELVTIWPPVADHTLTDAVTEALVDHLQRRPEGDQVMQMAHYLQQTAPMLAGDPELFHRLAFTTTRQFGAAAQLAAGFAAWWGQRRGVDLSDAVGSFAEAAEVAKRAQFGLGRGVRGRAVDLESQLQPAADGWATGLLTLEKEAFEA